MADSISGRNTCIDCIFGEYKKGKFFCHDCSAYVELCCCEHYVGCVEIEKLIKEKKKDGGILLGKRYFD